MKYLYLVLIGVIFAMMASPAISQSLSLDLGDGGSLPARSIQVLAVMTLLSLAPGIAVMVTCFPFIVTVLSILRQAIGLQQAPPNMLIVSLALFLTWFVMDPVFTEAWVKGVQPLNCQRRSKIRPKGGAKVDHFGVWRDGHAQSAGGQSAALLR